MPEYKSTGLGPPLFALPSVTEGMRRQLRCRAQSLFFFDYYQLLHIFALNNCNSMSKVYKTKEEAQDAVRRAVKLREKWEDAIRNKATREEMEAMGLKSVVNYED